MHVAARKCLTVLLCICDILGAVAGARGALSDGTNVTMSDQSLPSTAGPARPHAVVPPLPGASSEGPQASASGATGDAGRGPAAGLPPADSLELQSTCGLCGGCVASVKQLHDVALHPFVCAAVIDARGMAADLPPWPQPAQACLQCV